MKKLLAILVCISALFSVANGQWHEANNGLFGGHIGGLFVDPLTNGLFAGTGNCGIFISSDDGQHWNTSNSGLSEKVYNIESFVRSGNNLFAASQVGIFLSTNNGQTWVNKISGLSGVFCLTLSGTKIFAGTGDGILLSIDNGDTWTPVNNGLAGMDRYIYSIAVKGGSIFAGGAGGLFTSANDGGSWTKINLGLTFETIHSIVVDGNYIYAGDALNKFCISSDNGATWTVVSSGLPFGIDFQCLSVNNGVIYGGTTGGGVCISTDIAATWKQFNNVLSKKTIYKIAFHGNKIFAATESGVFLSEDNCTSWTEVNNGLTNIVVTSIVQSSNRLIAGTRGTGLFASSDNGNTWSVLNMGLTGVSPMVQRLLANDNYVYAGTMDGLFVSSDYGITWQKPNLNLSYNGNIIVDDIAVKGDQVFAGTSRGLYKSDDKGITWTTDNILKNEGLFRLVFNGNNLIGGTFAGVFLSTDHGNSWINISNGLPLTYTTILSVAVKDNNIFFACGDGIFSSTDNGSSWTKLNSGLPNVNVYALATGGNYLFAGTYNDGVSVSTNNGTNWTPMNSGLTGPALVCLTINVIGNEVYYGTNKGVWKRPLSEFMYRTLSTNSINIGPSENSTSTFNIVSNTSWTISSSDAWLLAGPISGYGNSSIELTAAKNTSSESRTASITVSSIGTPDESIMVTQSGNLVTSVEKVEDNFLEIYPNPAKDYLVINTGGFSEKAGNLLRITNMLGKVVFETQISRRQFEINLASWSGKGIYIIQLYDNENKILSSRKIILL